MKEEFEKMVVAGKLKPEHVAPLVEMATSGFCLHRKWGCGKITTIDTVFGRMTIDFPKKPGHSMDMGFAAGLLQPIGSEHILARKATDLAALKQMAALNHLELIKVVLQSFGGQATLEQIQQVLVPDVIADDWKKWWEAARKELKKDGHFKIPLKKTEPIIYQSEEIPLMERLLGEFRKARGLKAKMTVGYELLKSLDDFEDKAGATADVIRLLNENINSHQRTKPHLAIEAVLLREELREKTGIPAEEEELSATSIWEQAKDLSMVLRNLPAAKQRQALETYQTSVPDAWKDNLLFVLNELPTKLCGEAVKLMIEAGHMEEVKAHLAKLINQHQASTDLLLWLAKERSDAFADILGPEVFRSMLSAIERDQFNEKRSTRLPEFILQDQNLIVELLEYADLEIIKDVTRALQFSPSFEDVDKRSLLARIVKQFPAVQSLISGEADNREITRLVVTRESLERRRAEYEELVKKKIPDNSRDIAVARSYGDLRENHEYKSAKEMQKLLMKRKGELELELSRAQAVDLSNPNTDVVNIGCAVDVTDAHTGHRETFTILGAWDSDIENGVISYLTPLAQAMLNRGEGEEVEFDMDGQHKRYRIDAIRSAFSQESADGNVEEEVAGPSEQEQPVSRD